MSSFCVLPWVHLASHPAGHVSLCCESDHTNLKSSARTGGKLLNLKHNTIDDVLNSDYFKEVRLKMLRGEIPDECSRCFMKETKNIQSKRLFENERYDHISEDIAASTTSPDGTIPVNNVEFAELRLGNICNAQCRSCNPGSSSKWIKDYSALEENLIFMTSYSGTPEYKWPRKVEFWDELLANKNLKTLYINGGEPMLIKQHWEFIRRLVAEDRAKDITIEYSINMTLLPEDAVTIWQEFKDVILMVSIDDLGERNTYIRNPTKWEDVVLNLEKIKNNHLNIVVMQTVSAMNFFYIDEFYKWASDQNLMVTHNFVFDPSFLSPSILPLEIRKQVIDSCQHLSGFQLDNLKEMFYYNATPEGHYEKFATYTAELDVLRNEDFSETFPELWNALNEHA